MDNPSPALITLALRARTEREWLLVDYETRSEALETVYCYDGAPGDPGEEYPDLSRHLGLFVRANAPATVSVKRLLASPPPGKKVTKVVLPALSRLEPGRARAVRFRLPLPLADKSEFSPHFDGAVYEDGTARALDLVIGHMVLPAGSSAEPFPANPQAWKVRGAHGPQRFATASVPLGIPVRARKDGSFYAP